MDSSSGKCTQCRTDLGWKQDKIKRCIGYDQSRKACFEEQVVPGTRCTCDGYVDTSDGNKCKKCSELIPGCTKCEQIDAVDGEESFYKVGVHKFDSGIAGINRPIVVCKEGDASLVKVSDAEGKSALIRCDAIVNGCMDCNSDGKTCDECHYGWYRKHDGQCGSCKEKKIFGNCIGCNMR